jgi:hypothetical protein
MVLILAAGAVQAQDFVPEFMGVRGGFSTGGQGAANFIQAEGFADWNLPLKTESDSGWFLQPKLSLSVGWLDSTGANAVIGAAGPTVTLGKRGFPLSLEGGISATLISQHQFQTVDLGQEFQFTSYLGVNADLSRHWRVGYRYQHMSNGGLADSNPGLNMNMFSLNYAF